MANILCVDDDRDIRESLKLTLESQGHTIQTASSGKEGLEKAKSFSPDVILLDVMMESDTDGFHTAYEIRNDDSLKYTPILMLTSINQETKLGFNKDTDGTFLPVDEFIEKPIAPENLISLVNKLVALPKDKINFGKSPY